MTNNKQVLQAIVTKYIGPTNFRGSRIKATAAAGSITMAYRHELNIEDNHAEAAKLLASKFDWAGFWYQGGMPNDSGYCFVIAGTPYREQHSPAFATYSKETVAA